MIKITFHYRYRKQIIIASTILIFIAITSILYISNRPKKQLKVEKTNITLKKDKKETKEEVIEEYKVDIKGEVVNPGIYTLKSTSRIIDCIELAGGLTENANTTVLNLSKKITDEMVIIVYSNTEVEDFKKTKAKYKVSKNNTYELVDSGSRGNDIVLTIDILSNLSDFNTSFAFSKVISLILEYSL